MKPSSRPPRTPSKLSDSVHQQLNLYALAASAAGVSWLALVQPSEAKIVYTKTHHVIGSNGIYPLDLNHDGTIDFLIQQFGSSTTDALRVKEAFGNAVEGSKSLAAVLSKGAAIGSRQRFISSTGFLGEVMVLFTCTGGQTCSTKGQWGNVNNRYLGLKFQIEGKIHYGWARLSVKLQGARITGTLTGYAYETIPNQGIRAGQTHDQPDNATTNSDPTGSEGSDSAAVTQPIPTAPRTTSLGRLALGAGGAGGISPWRRP